MVYKVIKEKILKSNDDVASSVRSNLKKNDVFMFNIISSPGSGKTTLLEKSSVRLKASGVSYAVLTGDCFTAKDAARLDECGIQVVQINTGNSCHIDAQLVKIALAEVNLSSLDCVIVENVGNLVCPAEFDVGECCKVALLSVAEGHDKPLKYPLLFTESELVIINKMDLVEHTDFDIKECRESIHNLHPGVEIIEMSCKTGEGIDKFINWINSSIKLKRRQTA